MQKATKGAVLKHRIREMGYTQEEFSEVTGVAYSTLKKYLADKCPYDVDLLELFAEKLECSYDYLMGYSISPERELQSVKDATRLSDAAINNLKFRAKNYDDSPLLRNDVDIISKMIECEDFITAVAQYINPTQETEILYDFIKNLLREGGNDLEISVDGYLTMNLLNQINMLKYQ